MRSSIKQFGAPAVFLFLLLLAVLAYGQTLFFPFVHDDFVLIEHNPHITQWDFGAILHQRAIGPEGYAAVINLYYRPLLEIFYRLEYFFFGTNPAGYHLVNLIVHAVNAFLVFCLGCFWMEGRRGWAMALAILFLLHPVQTEAVACVSGISNLLCTSFGLTALYLYFLGREGRRQNVFYSLSLVSMFLALLAKEQAIVFPFLLWWGELFLAPGKMRKGRVAGYFVVGALYFALRKILSGSLVGTFIHFNYELFLRVAAIPRTILMYLRLIFLPYDLHYYRSLDILHPYMFSLVAFLVLAVAAGWFVSRLPAASRRVVLFSIGWFIIALFPVLNIVPLINEYSLILTAEHFLYIPSIGIGVLFLHGVRQALNRLPAQQAAAWRRTGIVILAALLWGLTVRQNLCWSGEVPLFERTVRFEPHFGRAHILLGKALYFKGRYKDAVAAYGKAATIMERYAYKAGLNPIARVYMGFLKGIYFERAHCYEALGEFEKAVENYTSALKIDPTDVVLHNNAAVDYIRLADFPKAIAHFQRALALDDTNASVRKNLAICYLEIHDTVRAKEVLEEILRRDPASDFARETLKRLEK